jgi:glycosyltransferase involved in cell wall biosynthesis
MKVIFLTKTYEPKIGGTYTVIKSIFDALKKKINIRIYDKKTNFIILIKAIRNSDVCHFFGGWDFFHIFFTLVAYYMEKKVIIHPLGFYEPWSLNQKKIKKKAAWLFYQKKILRRANLIHCVSEMEKKNILKLDSNLVTKVMPYGVPSIFFNKKIKKKKIKNKAIFFSRIHHKKGLDNLINEWSKIDNKNWSLDICGPYEDIGYYQSLLSLTKKNKLINFFKPIYKNIDKKKLFKNYDFMILPTKNDPFAMVVLESMACGLPVLTNHNTPWAIIKKLNAGWYIPDSKLSLNLALKKIFRLKSNDFYQKSKNSYLLSQEFNWNKVSNIYIAVYKRLIK